MDKIVHGCGTFVSHKFSNPQITFDMFTLTTATVKVTLNIFRIEAECLAFENMPSLLKTRVQTKELLPVKLVKYCLIS